MAPAPSIQRSPDPEAPPPLQDGVWAGNLELQAASRMLRRNVCVHQAGQPAWELRNFDGGSGHVLHLSYHDGLHYNSVRAADDYGSGPPEPITLPALRPAAEGRAWGEREVERAAEGDVDAAIEWLVEELAGGPEAEEQQQQQQAAQAPAEEQLQAGDPAEAAAAAAPAEEPGSASPSKVLLELGWQAGRPERALVTLRLVPEAPAAAAAAAEEAPQAGSGEEEGGAQQARKQKRRVGGSKQIKVKLRAGATAAAGGEGGAADKAPRRSKPCPCGSKLKYKNCCGVSAAAARRRAEAAGAVPASSAVEAATQQVAVLCI